MGLRFVLHLGLIASWLPFSIHGAASLSPGRITPPAGIIIAETVRQELTTGAAELRAAIDALRREVASQPQLRVLLPDVEIFHKAIHGALVHDEFFRSNEVALARQLLKTGLARVRELQAGRAPWLTTTGLTVRGFISRIDGSVQPYGLVVPASYDPAQSGQHRLDVWLHGRDNNLTELKFLSDRLKSPGEFAPADTFVLHPYGRYCNAFKFAGETDVFEALEHARRSYPIDPARVSVRGFSMGGAGTWHLAAHHARYWKAAAPGAGFAETAEYTKAIAKEPKPALFEQQLWHLYDATDYVANFHNFPVIAYSGELDKQKQAAEVMARAMKTEGLELRHLIGPGVEHKYEPATKRELAKQFDALMAEPANSRPERVRLTTWTLRYNRNKWVSIESLGQHWQRAGVDAQIVSNGWRIATSNVVAFVVEPAPMLATHASPLVAEIDGQRVAVRSSDNAQKSVRFERRGGKWAHRDATQDQALRKVHGLQGPIDDAFMDSFLMVRPTGAPLNEKLGSWVSTELARATNEWRAQFRGEARVRDDSAVTDADIAAHHLVLWGDPSSNRLLARILPKLPLRWDSKIVKLAGNDYAANVAVPVLIFPNPINPKRYVVLNSGFTFWREGAASNAQQTPKLPDYALLAMDKASTTEALVLNAGFFDEQWKAVRP